MRARTLARGPIYIHLSATEWKRMIKNRKVTVKHRILTGHVVLQAIPDAFGGVTIVPSCRFRKGEIREVSIRRETNGISFVLIDPRQATGGISLGGGILTETYPIGLTKNGPGL